MIQGKYARGSHAVGECARCGAKRLYKNLVFDGYYAWMRVCPQCYEARHPQERIISAADPVALFRPAPQMVPAPSTPVLSGIVTLGQPVLSWTQSIAGADFVTQYFLFRSTDGLPAVQIGNPQVVRDWDAAVLSYGSPFVDLTATAGHSYGYYVLGNAFESGNSLQSNAIILVLP